MSPGVTQDRAHEHLLDDQARALAFYTEVLCFVKRLDIPMGKYRRLTVTSLGDAAGTQLVLEPNEFPAAATFQRALFEAGIPATSFAVDDIADEQARLSDAGVGFRPGPTATGSMLVSIFADACGHLVQLHQA